MDTYKAMVTQSVGGLQSWNLNICTDHGAIPDTLKQKVSEMHERFLQLSDLQKIEKWIDSLLQDLRNAAKLAFEEQLTISELNERQGVGCFFGCQPTSFIKTFGTKMKSLEKMWKQNDKILKALETGLLLHFNRGDPLLYHVQNLLKRNRELSKLLSEPASKLIHYEGRISVELKWMSDFPRTLELCLQQFSIIMPTAIALQRDLSVESQIIDDLAFSKDGSQGFESKFRDLHMLLMTLESIQSKSRSSASVVQAMDDICTQCKNLASVYQEKKAIALGFLGCERFLKIRVPEVEVPLNKLHLQVMSAKKLYDHKFSYLPEDAQGAKSEVYMYKKAEEVGFDFSWRFRLINGRSIMPSLRNQERGQCAYASTMSCTGSLYKRKNAVVRIGSETYLSKEFVLNLSLDHLQDLVTSFCATNRIKGFNTLDYCLERMVAQGVITEEAYNSAKVTFHVCFLIFCALNRL
ncbi:hypothetical protein ACQJBY_008207 [Aegilops geniculata]